MALEPLVQADDLGFVYEGQREAAFSGLHGSIEEGEFWLFRGPNGVGKSTALRVLAGLAPRVFPGTVLGSGRVLGTNLTSPDVRGLAEQLGVLPDNPWAQVSGLRTTVRGEISLGLENRGWPVDAIESRVDYLLSQMRLGHVADRSPLHLSGGEYQALGFACAVAHRPQVLMLDEPELHLDLDHVASASELIRVAIDDGGAVVCATHLPRAKLPDVKAAWEIQEVTSVPRGEPALLWPLPCRELVAELRGVVFRYPGQEALLEGVDLQLRAGVITALTGPNGAGKTTIARLVLGLIRPLEGSIRICGRDTQKLRASEVAKDVSIAFQDPRFQLFRRTVREEITSSLPEDSNREAGESLAMAFGIEAGLDLSPYDLPWSHRRLAAIACAVARRPRLLVVDEPTAGLDQSERARVAALLRHWAAHGGSVLLITHDSVWARACCDVEVAMSDLKGRSSCHGEAH